MDFDDMPEQSLEEHIHEVQHQDLFLLAQTMSLSPKGEDTYHQPPAHDLLPLLQEALDKWGQVEKALYDRIPGDLAFKADLESKKTAGGWQKMAEESPEVRRFWEVSLVKSVMEHLFDHLQDEGRPRSPAPNLKLGKMRKEGWAK